MTFAHEVSHLVDDCALYWAETGIPRRRVTEMRMELASTWRRRWPMAAAPPPSWARTRPLSPKRGRSSIDRSGGRLLPGRT